MSITDVIGNTPVVELSKLNPNPKVKILGKLEGNNPGGSSKDRIAHFMVYDAEEAGILKKKHIILEPTSGNTGIGLALHNGELDTMSIAHRVDGDGAKERLFSLNGEPREIIRDSNQVRCILPIVMRSPAWMCSPVTRSCRLTFSTCSRSSQAPTLSANLIDLLHC